MTKVLENHQCRKCKKLRKAYNLCDEANIDLKEEINALRKELNERSWVTLEEELTEAKGIIRALLKHSYGQNLNTQNDFDLYLGRIKDAEDFLKENK